MIKTFKVSPCILKYNVHGHLTEQQNLEFCTCYLTFLNLFFSLSLRFNNCSTLKFYEVNFLEYICSSNHVYAWLVLCDIMFSSFIHLTTNDSTSSFYDQRVSVCACVCVSACTRTHTICVHTGAHMLL